MMENPTYIRRASTGMSISSQSAGDLGGRGLVAGTLVRNEAVLLQVAPHDPLQLRQRTVVDPVLAEPRIVRPAVERPRSKKPLFELEDEAERTVGREPGHGNDLYDQLLPSLP